MQSQLFSTMTCKFLSSRRFSICFILILSLFISCNTLEYDDKSETANDAMSGKNIKSLEEQFSSSIRQQANTASDVDYLTKEEKELFYYLNLARLEPKIFAQTFVANYNHNPGNTAGYAFTERKQSLIDYLNTMEPLPALVPNETLFEYADCFATESGIQGIVGHDRTLTSCPKDKGFAECCAYTKTGDGIWHILQFLVDAGEGNSFLGHRRILLEIGKTSRENMCIYMGAAIRPHKTYGKVSVLDLWNEKSRKKYEGK